MLWKLCDWEQNGYHDSYFNDGYFNDETNTFQSHETGATAYASGAGSLSDKTIDNAPLEVIAACKAAMVAIVKARFRNMDDNAKTPNGKVKGKMLKLSRDVKHKGVVYKKGTTGMAFWEGSYGTFYKNGYNKPNRSNTRVGLKVDDKSIFVALEACERAEDGKTDAQLVAQATFAVMNDSNAVKYVVPVHAWTSHNWWKNAIVRLTMPV